MPELTRSQMALYALAALAVIWVGVHALGSAESQGAALPPAAGRAEPARPAVRVTRPAGASLIVHVAGAVHRPGIYKLAPGARIYEAIRRAGGRARGADLDAINLAAAVQDGEQVLVPRRGHGPAAAGAPAGDAARPGGAAVDHAPVDLNHADADALQTLDGVGPATAAKIIAWRTAHGGFHSVDDLEAVPGIGPKKLAAIRPRARV